MTVFEARKALREATGCSFEAAAALIPVPSANRTLLAGMALQGLLADSNLRDSGAGFAAMAVKMADALIAELEKEVP